MKLIFSYPMVGSDNWFVNLASRYAWIYFQYTGFRREDAGSTRKLLETQNIAKIKNIYHGSNSWIILSNLITAKSLELKPARQASASTVNTIKLFEPAVFNIGALEISMFFDEFSVVAILSPLFHVKRKQC